MWTSWGDFEKSPGVHQSWATADLDRQQDVAPESPEIKVQKALDLLDRLESLSAVPEARQRLPEVFAELEIWVGLDFTEGRLGKRSVRKVRSGMITMGGNHLPVPLHGRDHCGPKETTDDCGRSAGPIEAAMPAGESPGGLTAAEVEKTAKVNQEDDSSTKVNRGDTI